MKKLLLLLFLPILMVGQTIPSDATALENIQITNNVEDNASIWVNVQNANGVINKVLKSSIKSPIATSITTGTVKITTGEVDPVVYTNTITDSKLGLKANIASPTFTGTVVGITKSMVGLSSVDNTTDLNKPISTATQTALNLKENAFTKNTAFNKPFGITTGTVVQGGTLGSNAYNSVDYLPLTGGKVTGVLKTGGFRVDGNITVGNGEGLEVYYDTSNKTVYFQNYDRGVTNNYHTLSFAASKFDFSGGNATFVGTIQLSPATTDTQAVTRGQMNTAIAAGGASSGTYTPTFAGYPLPTLNKAFYSVVGKLVTATISCTTINTDTGLGVFNVSLPFTSSSSSTYSAAIIGSTATSSGVTSVRSAINGAANSSTQVSINYSGINLERSDHSFSITYMLP